MDRFIKFLLKSKTEQNATNSKDKVHVVMGNESCDLDSTVCSLILGYLLNECTYKDQPAVKVLPVLNVDFEHYLLRTEVRFVLKKVGIDEGILIFRDNINLKEICDNCNLHLSLVDHHILPLEDQFLSDSVVQIFDHRPIDPNFQRKDKVNVIIKPVGSCSTLIAQEILRIDDSILSQEIATLLYDTIIYDTIALIPEHGKVTETDENVIEALEKKFMFVEDRKTIYETLWNAHNDVSHLSAKQLLLKDLKIAESIPVPGLPMLVEEYLKMDEAISAVNIFAAERNCSLIVLMGLEAKQEVTRDLAIFSTDQKSCLYKTLLHNLENSEDRGFSLCLKEVPVNIPNIVCFRQNNIKPSRKQILPIIKDTVKQTQIC